MRIYDSFVGHFGRSATAGTEACLMIDVQERYMPGDCESLRKIKEMLPDIRDRMPVIWVYMDELSRELDTPQRASHGICSALFNRLAKPSPFHFANAPVIEPVSDDWIMTKYECSAFRQGNLDPFLQARNIRSIYIAGYVDNVCVLQTAAAGKSLGYRSKVLRDLTGETPGGASQDTLKMYRKRGISHMASKDLLLSPVR